MAGGVTKAQQQTAVGEGLAVGCLTLGHERLPSSKLKIEFAFRKAWRDWPYAIEFGHVRATLERNDIMIILRASPRRRRQIVAYWEVGRELRPVLAGSHDLDHASDLLVRFYDLPLTAWQQLAQTFADELLRR